MLAAGADAGAVCSPFAPWAKAAGGLGPLPRR